MKRSGLNVFLKLWFECIMIFFLSLVWLSRRGHRYHITVPTSSTTHSQVIDKRRLHHRGSEHGGSVSRSRQEGHHSFLCEE